MKIPYFLQICSKKFGGLKFIRTFAIPNENNTFETAEIAQLVEHNLAKVRVASSSLVFRSKTGHLRMTFVMRNNQTWYNYICSRSLTETAFFYCKSLPCTPVARWDTITKPLSGRINNQDV